MGCDIYGFIEVKLNGVWHAYNRLQISRDYWLFAKMAGVRNDSGRTIEPISPPKGPPTDISAVTQAELANWGVDAHSVSWLSRPELESLSEWYKTFPPYRWETPFHADRSFDQMFGYMFGSAVYSEEVIDRTPVERVRCVFWFDN